jgi:ribosome-binding factor A
MSIREDKITEIVKKLAAEFISKEADKTSMITVTDAKISKDLRKVIIFISVYPKSSEKAALNFAKRRRGEFKKFARNKIIMKRIPFFDFEISKAW